MSPHDAAPTELPFVPRVDAHSALPRLVLAGVAVLTVLTVAVRQDTHLQQGPAQAISSRDTNALGATVVSSAPASPLPSARYADFNGHRASPEARHVADWVADSRDNAGADFIVLDKRLATLYVFNADARLSASTPVLLGAARGDESVADIGTRPLAAVQLHERTTPAGRFVAERGYNAQGEDIVWVDYDAALSMHRVRATQPKERRLQRLASKTIADNRISYGCINIPVSFYERFVRPTFASRRAIVYILPEDTSAEHVFGSYDVAAVRAASRRLALRR